MISGIMVSFTSGTVGMDVEMLQALSHPATAAAARVQPRLVSCRIVVVK